MIELVMRHVMPAALSVLPARMDTAPARAMLVAVGLQESRFLHRQQSGGPARGFWQFERAGVHGVMMHSTTREPLADAMRRLRYGSIVGQIEPAQTAITHNDILACVFARLLLWTLPSPLPHRSEAAKGWLQYLDAWRPGRPHAASWEASFEEAWARVVADANFENGVDQ